MKNKKMSTKTRIASFFLILMSIQYVLLEGYFVSYIKFGAMCLTPLILLVYTPKISKVLIFGGLYFLALLTTGINNYESFRFSTVGYTLSFVFMFITYYNLVYHEKVFSIDSFIKLLQIIILLYAGVLLLQQLANVVGVHDLLIINQVDFYTSRGLLTGNSISLEQSHSARILTVAFFALISLSAIKYGEEGLSVIKRMFKDNKWVVIGFLWTMLTMGSGTAFVGIALILLSFVNKKYILIAVPLLIGLYTLIPYIDFEPLQRARVTAEAAITLDTETISDADLSASARVLPFVYTIEHFDLSKRETWFGHGIDTGLNNDKWGREQMIGGMTDFGFISYLFALIFIFRCVIRKFFSIETLIFFVMFMFEIRSIYVWWSAFMIWTTVRYFQNQKNKYDLTNR